MKTLLMSIFLVSIPIGFIGTFLYFSYLSEFKKSLLEHFPDQWNDFSKRFILKTGAQQAYEAFKETKSGYFMSAKLPIELVAIRNRINKSLLTGVTSFFMIIITMFLIEGVQ